MNKAHYFQPRTDIDWPLLRKQCEIDGLSFRQLAIKFGVAQSTISFHASRDKWNVSACRRARSLTQAVANGKPLRSVSGHFILPRNTQAVLAQFGANQISSKLNASTYVAKALRTLASLPDDQALDRAKDAKAIIESANILFGWLDPKRAQNGTRHHLALPNMLDLTPDQLAKLAAIEISVQASPSLDSPSSPNTGTPEEPKHER